MKTVFCLAGAGANPSLSVSALTHDLMEWRGHRDPTGTAEVIGSISSGKSDKRQPFFRWLHDHVDRARNAIGPLTFEELIHLVEIVASEIGTIAPETEWLTDSEPGYLWDLLRPTELGLELARQNTSFIAVKGCIYLLERIVARTRYEHPLPAAAYLLARLRDECSTHLQVFSLNYETSVTDAVSTDWWTGFVPIGRAGQQVKIERFEPSVAIPQARDLNIQLHGSTHFGLSMEFSDDRVTRLLRYPNVADAERAWSITTSDERAQDGHVLLTVPMITGRRKADMILREPFASYFHYFREAALSTPHWLILGYGGKDPHVNTVLATAAEKWGDELRVVVCNYLPDEDLIGDPPGTAAFQKRYWLSPDRQDTSGKVHTILAPFSDDYEQFFRERRFVEQGIIWRGRGEIFSRVMLTVDGEYLGHFNQIRHWLRL
jgi:hypothetical protein